MMKLPRGVEYPEVEPDAGLRDTRVPKWYGPRNGTRESYGLRHASREWAWEDGVLVGWLNIRLPICSAQRASWHECIVD